MQRARVLLLIPHLGGGGAEQVAALLARGLPPQKYEIHLGLIAAQSAAGHSLPASVTVHFLGAPRVRAGALRLLRLVRRLRPALVLSGMFHLNFLVLLLRPLFPAGTRVLVRQNTTVSAALASGSLPWFARRLYRLLYRHADRVICQSRDMAEDLSAQLGVNLDRIAILPNPVDLEAIAAAKNRPDLWSGPGPHLLAVGRLAPEKGFDLLLEAFATVRASFPQADLLIAGAGAEEAQLKARRHRLGLESAVRFSGHVHPPYCFFPGASLFVLSSRLEGMPNALLEAAAAGLPLASLPSSQGVAHLLRDGPGVWLAPEISAPALAATLLRALQVLTPGQRFAHAFVPEEPAAPIKAYEELIDACIHPAAPISHVALVLPGLDRIGGAERQVILLAKGLRRRGWRVSVLALSGSGAAAAELAQAGVAFSSLGMRKGLADPRGWLRFHRWLRRERPSVVHAHLPHAAWLARCSRLFVPIPILIDTLHSAATGKLGRRLGYRMSNFLTDRVTAVSHEAAAAHLRARTTSKAKLTVLPNGVEDRAIETGALRTQPSVRAEVRRELGLTDEFLWLAAGRLEPVKDYPTLLQAMTGVPQPAQLLIAGSGARQQELAGLAARLGLLHRVRFLGFQTDIHRWMLAADGFVLSSLCEGLPSALLEAAACALPAVATAAPGIREALLDGETGYLVRPGDAAALAAAMRRLMRTPTRELKEMGVRARRHALERFSLDSVLDRWEALYRECGAALPASGGTPALKGHGVRAAVKPASAIAPASHTPSLPCRAVPADAPPAPDRPK